MKGNNQTTFIILSGAVILIVFAIVLIINVLPDDSSNSYYVKVGDDMSAKIESVHIENHELILETSGNPIEYCVKSTKTAPEINSVCWKEIVNNLASISVFPYKKYYVWIKDNENNISNYVSVNTDNK